MHRQTTKRAGLALLASGPILNDLLMCRSIDQHLKEIKTKINQKAPVDCDADAFMAARTHTCKEYQVCITQTQPSRSMTRGNALCPGQAKPWQKMAQLSRPMDGSMIHRKRQPRAWAKGVQRDKADAKAVVPVMIAPRTGWTIAVI